MKKTLLTLIVLIGGLIGFNACKQTAINNSTVIAGNMKTTEINTVPTAPTPPKETKVPAEKNIENGSVKADDYEENSVTDKKKSADLCDVEAYVIDKDPKGLNIRDFAEKGKVIGVIPFDGDGTIVHIISTNNKGWLQIDRAETVEGKVVFDKKGWVAANLLGTSTTGYGGQGVELNGSKTGVKVVTFIPPETEVRMFSCDAKRVQIKYEKYTGWLEPELACPNPVTNCN